MQKSELAIYGGQKVRKTPLPYRKLFGDKELKSVIKVFKDSWKEGVDFGFQGKFERIYTDKFCEFQGAGFADAVSSGTAAIYLALKAINIKPGSDVLVSPVTNPGSVTPIILQGLNVVIADAQPDSFNIGPEEFRKALTANTRAAILTHLGGQPINIEPILEIAKAKKIKIIEDCSQAHGALYKGKRVGRFGDIAAFSTMFSKAHSTGGCGGLVYTENEDYYWLIRSLADRGKPFHIANSDLKNAALYLFPALNFNLNELSCAIGSSTLSRLQETINQRQKIAQKINIALKQSSVVYPIQPQAKDAKPSLYFHTVGVAVDKLKVSKREFANAVAAEGIWINSHYSEIVSEWKWLKKFVNCKMSTPNALVFRAKTFNILFNEKFKDSDVTDIISSILKVESYFKKNARS